MDMDSFDIDNAGQVWCTRVHGRTGWHFLQCEGGTLAQIVAAATRHEWEAHR